MSLALDSNIFIYTLEGHSVFGKTAADLLKDCLRQPIPVVLSEIVFVEVLATGKLSDTSARRAQAWLENMGFRYYPVTKDILITAARLRRQHSLRSPDAIHVASALKHGAEYFITNDNKLAKKNIAGIKFVLLGNVPLSRRHQPSGT